MRHLGDLFDLDNATNDRLLAENDRLPGIGVHELRTSASAVRIVKRRVHP